MAERSNEVATLLCAFPAAVWWESFKKRKKKAVIFTWRFHHILTAADE